MLTRSRVSISIRSISSSLSRLMANDKLTATLDLCTRRPPSVQLRLPGGETALRP